MTNVYMETPTKVGSMVLTWNGMGMAVKIWDKYHSYWKLETSLGIACKICPIFNTILVVFIPNKLLLLRIPLHILITSQ